MVQQVGGDHYAAPYQHWDMVIDTQTGYMEGNATKYLGRWRKKNGVLDLEKAESYIEKMIEEVGMTADFSNHSLFLKGNAAGAQAFKNLSKWFNQAEIHQEDRTVIQAVLFWSEELHLRMALDLARNATRAARLVVLAGAGRVAHPPARPATGQPTPPGGATPQAGAGSTNHPAPFGFDEDEGG